MQRIKGKPLWIWLLLLAIFLSVLVLEVRGQEAGGQGDEKPKPYVAGSSFLLGPVFSGDQKSIGAGAILGPQFKVIRLSEKVSLGAGAGVLLGYRNDRFRPPEESKHKFLLGLGFYVPLTVWQEKDDEGRNFAVTVAYVYGHRRLVMDSAGRDYHGIFFGSTVWR